MSAVNNDKQGWIGRFLSPKEQLVGAMLLNNLDEVKRLLNDGLSVNSTNSNGESLLLMAIEYQKPSVIDFLIKSGADMYFSYIDWQNKKRTPLMDALSVPNNLEVLLKNGLNPNYQAIDSNTPLHHCAKHKSVEYLKSAELLLKYGADIMALNDEQKTPWDVLQESESPGKQMIALFTANIENRHLQDQIKAHENHEANLHF